MAISATFLAWAAFDEFAFLKPALLRCVQHIHIASNKSSGSFEVGLYTVRCASKVDLKMSLILAVHFQLVAASVWRILRFRTCRCLASMLSLVLMILKRRQFRFEGMAGFPGPARSRHIEANNYSVRGGGRGCLNFAILFMLLHGEHHSIIYHL